MNLAKSLPAALIVGSMMASAPLYALSTPALAGPPMLPEAVRSKLTQLIRRCTLVQMTNDRHGRSAMRLAPVLSMPCQGALEMRSLRESASYTQAEGRVSLGEGALEQTWTVVVDLDAFDEPARLDVRFVAHNQTLAYGEAYTLPEKGRPNFWESLALVGSVIAGPKPEPVRSQEAITEASAAALRQEFSRLYTSRAELKKGQLVASDQDASLPRSVAAFKGVFANYDDQNFDVTVVRDKAASGQGVYKLLAFTSDAADDPSAGYYLQLFSQEGKVLGYCQAHYPNQTCSMLPGDFDDQT